MMHDMSVTGELSQIYTNHCIKRTVVQKLDDSGYQAKDIMVITGHKHSSPLQPYLGRPNLNCMHERTLMGYFVL